MGNQSFSKIARSAVLGVAALSMGGCMYYGTEGYDPYYDSYYDPYYDSYPVGAYGYSYFGWYDDFYYPGAGIYIYDRYGKRHRWNQRHQRYWEGRRGRHKGRENWAGYSRGKDGYYRDQRRGDRYHNRDQRGGDRAERRGDRRGDRADRREDRRGDRADRRQSRAPLPEARTRGDAMRNIAEAARRKADRAPNRNATQPRARTQRQAPPPAVARPTRSQEQPQRTRERVRQRVERRVQNAPAPRSRQPRETISSKDD